MSILLDKILALSVDTLPEVTALSSESVCVLLFAQQLLANPKNWLDTAEDQADVITPDDLNQIETLTANIMWEIMHPLIGIIMPYLLADAPLGTLPCDGSVYTKEAYPLLYETLDDAFIIDDDTFFVPDMRGLALIGVSDTHAIGTIGGSETVTLDVSQIPSHSHTNAPHTHAEGSAIPAIINGGLEAPASAAVPIPAITGASSVIIDSTGGGGSHENMQPYIAVKYCIGAG